MDGLHKLLELKERTSEWSLHLIKLSKGMRPES